MADIIAFVLGNYQMVAAHNFAPGNAGVIFYSDFLVPIVGFALLWLQRRAAVPR
jgi:hypothetical protein